MKALFAAAAVLLAATALSPVSRAEGPRPSSENNWPGMAERNGVTGGAYPVYDYRPEPAAAPHYEWQEGYEHGGKWHGHWVLVR